MLGVHRSVPADGPTTKADCLNHLYDALIAYEVDKGRSSQGHRASTRDVVHPVRAARIFDGLIDRAAVVQLPVLPLVDRNSRWISGHYCDEFAEAHIKELVVREAVGAAVPLAGVGCAIARRPLAQLAAMQDGKPFAGASMTEDYELGLRLGALGLKTMFVRIPAQPGEPGVVASRGHFHLRSGQPSARKARWLGGIALAGWDRLGWRAVWVSAGCACATAAVRFAALLLICGYAAFLWSQLWLAEALQGADSGAHGPRPHAASDGQRMSARLAGSHARLLHRIRIRLARRRAASIPRLVVGNVVAMLAARRSIHFGGGAGAGTRPGTSFLRVAPMRPSCASLGSR